MNKHFIETITGAVVILIAIWCVYFFTDKTSNIGIINHSYKVVAKFHQSDGITIGSPVKIGGIKVGVVVATDLDKDTYFANITMSVNNDVLIPKDSSVKIVSSGLLGDKYISIDPGGDEEMLKDGGEIKYTQSSINFESLLGRFFLGSNNE